MPDFMDNRRVTPTLYLANGHPDDCLSKGSGKTPPLISKDPLTLCTCTGCYPLSKAVMEKHGHRLADWVNEPGEWT